MSALDLDLLSEYLDGDQNEYGLDFAATHGFLCAIAVGPTFAKWLDELFDNNSIERLMNLLKKKKYGNHIDIVSFVSRQFTRH